MAKEYVNYKDNLPINFQLAKVNNYPLAWQDSTKILFVLRGSINVTMANEVYRLREREIEIINKGEIYKIRSNEDNLVLILDIAPGFISKYTDNMEDVYYYTNSLEGNNQWDNKYKKLRGYIAILFYEIIYKNEDYEDKIENTLLGMMYHLLNHFHYLFYEEESLREDDLQFERFNRIINYIRKNYNKRVSLKEISEREYLTPQYLSYKIKDTFGQNFNDFVNQIRVEESRKLLLTTDKSISEIALDCGFSHSRYYNKHFKNIYSKLPIEYREENQKDQVAWQKEKDITYYDLEKAEEYLKSYLLGYERYGIKKTIVKRHIDIKERKGLKFIKPSILDLGDVSLILEEDYKTYLEDVQKDIGFKYCLMDNLFSGDTDIYLGENKFINWTRVENILEVIRDFDLIPLMDLNKLDEYVREDFVENVEVLDINDLEEEKEKVKEELGPNLIVNRGNINDKVAMATYLIHNQAYLNKQVILQLSDEITQNVNMTNDTFFGGRGIITSTGLKKPSYYGLMFLGKMGDEIIYKEEGIIVTSSSRGYEILLYNPSGLPKSEPRVLRLFLNILNLKGDYLVTRYRLGEEDGSIYNKWEDIGSPERLSNEDWEVLDRYVGPRVDFKKVTGKNIHNLITNLNPDSIELYILKPI